jgi:hypothetical protein
LYAMLSSKVDLPLPLSPTKMVMPLLSSIFFANCTAGILNGKGFCFSVFMVKELMKGMVIFIKQFMQRLITISFAEQNHPFADCSLLLLLSRLFL